MQLQGSLSYQFHFQGGEDPFLRLLLISGLVSASGWKSKHMLAGCGCLAQADEVVSKNAS